MSPANLSLNAQSWGSEPSDNITIADANINNGREDGNNSRPGYENEPQNLDGEDIPLGTGEQSAESLPVSLSIDADAKMNLTEVEKRFFDATRIGLKASSQRYYFDRFRKMIRVVHLGDYSKRQLAGPIGKRLILDYISTVSKPSVRTQLAAIKRVWMNGIGLPWPIDAKMDIGKLPKVERESTPPNQPVQEWAKSLSIEKDPYLKLVWLFMAQHGWRPSHATGMRWSDIRYDDLGHPCAVRTTGARAEFKTYAPVAVNLAPDVIQALEEWRKVHSNPNGNAWILPHRGLTGKLDVNRRMKTRHFEKLWQCIQEKYGLPKLGPKDLRHWVSTACRKAGLSKPASNYLQGHEADIGSNMRDIYDNPPVEEWLQEQKDILPNGPLGTLTPIEVELIADIPPESVNLLKQYLDGKLGIMGLMTSLEGLKMKLDANPLRSNL